MIEATRRMEELYNAFGTRGAASLVDPGIDFTRHAILFLAGQAYTVPLELPPDDAERSETSAQAVNEAPPGT
jgi:hypothetical protein